MDDNEYHDMVRRLVAMMANQDKINDRLTVSIERIDTAIEGINTTLARVETLLARIIPQSENGREA